ncbi:hypothetical protein, partial [Bradyrhizobium sp. MOS001]|uniref:hypothetical protein n=1 Tax=Bradyrhizobium sp. MOS001 TaxID=2133948 RepID=UPI001960C07A
ARIVAHDMERVFADIDADHGDRGIECLGHGVLLVLAPLASLSLAGQEHGRTIPLTEIGRRLIGFTKSRSMWFATRCVVCSLNRAGRSPHGGKLKNPVSPSKDVQRTQSFRDEHAAIAIL